MSKNKDELFDFANESILQVLKLAFEKSEHLKQIGDISGYEIIINEVIPKYEVLYISLNEEYKNDSSKKIDENIESLLNKILDKNNLSKEFILESIKLREKFKEDSGAKVVKNFFEFKKKDLNTKIKKSLKRANILLDEEERLNLELSNSIQEIDQINIIEKLLPVREEFAKVSKEISDLENQIKDIENKLLTKWPYEIYGTLPKNEIEKFIKKMINGGQNGN